MIPTHFLCKKKPPDPNKLEGRCDSLTSAEQESTWPCFIAPLTLFSVQPLHSNKPENRRDPFWSSNFPLVIDRKKFLTSPKTRIWRKENKNDKIRNGSCSSAEIPKTELREILQKCFGPNIRNRFCSTTICCTPSWDLQGNARQNTLDQTISSPSALFLRNHPITARPTVSLLVQLFAMGGGERETISELLLERSWRYAQWLVNVPLSRAMNYEQSPNTSPCGKFLVDICPLCQASNYQPGPEPLLSIVQKPNW